MRKERELWVVCAQIYCFVSKLWTWLGCLETSPYLPMPRTGQDLRGASVGGRGRQICIQTSTQSAVSPTLNVSHDSDTMLMILLNTTLFFLPILPVLWNDGMWTRSSPNSTKTCIISHLDILISSLGEALPETVMKSEAKFYLLDTGVLSLEQEIGQLIICLTLCPQYLNTG